MHSTANRRAATSTLVGMLLSLSACNWVSLARGAATYEDVRRGEASNVVASADVYYAALAEDGIVALDASTGATIGRVPPPVDSSSVDDLAVDGTLLFVLDARPPGSISVYSLGDPARPRRVAGPYPVAVGPFSGVSASGGICIVSGGTSSLTAWTYDSLGTLFGPVATTDLGRGQPDVLVTAEGKQAFVSTHYWGPYFGLSRLRVDTAPLRLTEAGTAPLDGAGFSVGGARPANFPIEATAFGVDTVLIAHARGLSVFHTGHATQLDHPRVINVDGPAVSVDAHGEVAAVAVGGDHPAVVFVRLTAGTAKVTRRVSLPPGTFPAGIALSATSVAVAARSAGVLVIRR
jgi:hypothetical protein